MVGCSIHGVSHIIRVLLGRLIIVKLIVLLASRQGDYIDRVQSTCSGIHAPTVHVLSLVVFLLDKSSTTILLRCLVCLLFFFCPLVDSIFLCASYHHPTTHFQQLPASVL